MKTEKTNNSEKDEATGLLKAVIDWWENWISSDNPTEVSDPPVDRIRKYLLEKKDSKIF